MRSLDHGGKGHFSLAKSRSWRSRKFSRQAWRSRHFSIGMFLVLLIVGVIITLSGADQVLAAIQSLRGEELSFRFPGLHDEENPGVNDTQEQEPFRIETEKNVDDAATDGQRSDLEIVIRPTDGQDISRKANPLELKRNIEESAHTRAVSTVPADAENGRLAREEDRGKVGGTPKKKSRHPSTPACEISFRNASLVLGLPTDMSVFDNFSLNYVQTEEQPEDYPTWQPKFAGHQSLWEREASYLAQDQTLHCGFVEGPEGSSETGFELSKDDIVYLQTCRVAVSSCIFGNYDRLRNPRGKRFSSDSRENVCFVMFVDRESLDGMIEDGEIPDGNMTRGLWRIVLVKTLPYADNRRTGKVPKFLTHRLFPRAEYSIWLDSKLRLQSDPLSILDHFLWQGSHEYAISNHYDRHCVWEEVAQNKKLNKFSHSVIDEQFEFYQKDGLTRFNSSDPNKLLPSHVPEGSFIVRAHTPMSNLFSCLWFNEVERFTPRDQLSFAYTFMKFVRMNPFRHFHFHMFKDCERKEMAKLFHHRAEEVSKQG